MQELLNQNLPELEASLKTIQEPSHLNHLEEAEKVGKNRDGALKAIAARRIELMTGDDEDKKLEDEKAKLAAERQKIEEERMQLEIDRRKLEASKSQNIAALMESSSAMLVKDLAVEQCPWLPKPLITKGTRLYFYRGSDFRNYPGQKKVAVTFNQDGSAPFFVVPINSILFE